MSITAISDTEPVRSAGRWLAAFVGGGIVLTTAFLQLLAAFGAAIDPVQQAAIITFVTAIIGIVGPLVGAEVLRNKVTPWTPEFGARAPVGEPRDVAPPDAAG